MFERIKLVKQFAKNLFFPDRMKLTQGDLKTTLEYESRRARNGAPIVDSEAGHANKIQFFRAYSGIRECFQIEIKP